VTISNRSAGRFAGKVAVITGAAQGIGFATAQRMGREGCRIVIADFSAGPAAEAVAALTAEGIEAIAAVGDLSVYAQAEAAMQQAKQVFGAIHILVNNVGGTIWMKPFWYYTEEEIRAEVNRSFWPTMWCARAVIPVMRDTGGVIVNVSSNAVEGEYRIPYSASKGAVEALTTALAVEVAGFGIRVNCIAPGGTSAPERKTQRNVRPLTAQEQQWQEQFMMLLKDEELLTPWATAEQQAGVIAFLASDDAAHITGEIVHTGRRGKRIFDKLGFVP
jgi:dihydroxycyclohexadiene carboxylate dehydrogenase